MTTLVNKFLDVVEAADLERPDTDFIDAAFAALALAISRLGRPEREAHLVAIERGTLREAVRQFNQPASDRWKQ
jgi:hypothetical protein